jgi:hypothetical protein
MLAVALGPRLEVVPVTLREARAFVAGVHRLQEPPQGGRFAIGCADDRGRLRGVVIVGRPLAQRPQDGRTCEVTRCATDGAPNACSILYGAAWRAARAMGFLRLVTYTLASEPGTSLRAAGLRPVARVSSQSWNRPRRPRRERVDLGPKVRWEITQGHASGSECPRRPAWLRVLDGGANHTTDELGGDAA